MKIFENRKNNLVYLFDTSVRSQLASLINDEEQVKPTPIVMDPTTIKQILKNIKEDKKKFKSFILNFDALNEFNKLTSFLEYYHSANTYLLEDAQIDLYKQTNPNKMTIKTDFVIEIKDLPDLHFDPVNPSESYVGESNLLQYNTYFEVYVKEGFKLSKFKTYSPEEISNMVASGDIIITKAYERKPIPYKKFIKSVCSPEFKIIHDGFYLDTLTEEMINEMKTNNPEVFEEMMNDINLDEIKQYYEQEYLPLYKKCLTYLAECAKVSVAKEQADRKTFTSQINKSYKTEQKIKDISKEIIDTSKGR